MEGVRSATGTRPHKFLASTASACEIPEAEITAERLVGGREAKAGKMRGLEELVEWHVRKSVVLETMVTEELEGR
jgi:hypothetical protein